MSADSPMAGSSEASRQAADVADQLGALESVTDVSLGHLDVDDLLIELLDRVAGLMAVDTVAVLLLDEVSQQLVARAAWGIEEEVRQGARVPVGHGFAGRIAATGQPVVLDRVDSSTVANPLLWEKGIRTMLGVPLLSGEEVLGVLHVGSVTKRSFTQADSELLARVASRVAAAMLARQRDVERAAARVVQRSLVPTPLPQLPGIEFAARYVPAEIGGVGGDWYDAFALPDGRLWVMVGDVVGHGVRAGLVMGRLRSSLRSYALDYPSPEEVLARADHKLQFFEPGETATVLCAVLDPPYEAIQLSLAGHPPPVVVTPDAPGALVEVNPGLPLGVDHHIPRSSVRVPLGSDAVLITYTDGLIERRGKSLDDGFALLCRAAHAHHPEQVCFEVMDALIGRHAPEDDIAVLAVRRHPIDEEAGLLP
ncbi:MAG: SpoIIE family protein phosphatase [Acidimicrobiales bacterium]|nr:SpoIIE family protein phosphatase [Acidimicrobiales bacterium]